MCICKQPDVRSDYTMLAIPLALHDSVLSANNTDRSHDDNLSRDGGRAGHNHMITSPDVELDMGRYHLEESSHEAKVSSLEKGLRFVVVVFLMFISLTLHRQQQEVTAQRNKLLDSIRKDRESRKVLRHGIASLKYDELNIEEMMTSDELVRVNIDYDSLFVPLS